jgi:uncharacterized protein (TIGR02600 family)
VGGGASGPYINKADEGLAGGLYYAVWNLNYSKTFFSPNRQISSPVQFGSLSTGVRRQLPWQTLLFRPDPQNQHPGSVAPKDHLLLDLFQMPVVEPYAISEPLSTAGRINMNYRLAPFSHITRETALRAALKAVMVTSIHKDRSNYNGQPYRFRIHEEETLKAFERRFNLSDPTDPQRKGLFVSASEICDVPLVPSVPAGYFNYPQQPKLTDMPRWWDDHVATADNLRESPYNRLYPLLTTKSNTYTVHVRAQSLRKRPGSAPDLWEEGRDSVAAEHRGWSLVERYVDTGAPGLPDFATASSETLERFYRFRILGSKRFTSF